MNKSNFIITQTEVFHAVKQLKNGKNDGNNILSTEFFHNAPSELLVHLSLLFTAIVAHGVIPSDMCVTTIVPIPKSGGNFSESANYRAIALSSILGKILDYIFLDRLQEYLFTSELQFGFKSKHSTSMCTFILKETVAYYTSHNTSVYCCFLDASKAFDRICHVKLFKKLLDRNIPAVIIRFLINVYLVQTANVRWGGVLSDAFAVSNGVKQGGISSPILFCVYVDGLLRQLKEAKLGCHIGREYVGALAYADDFTLLAPTADAMRNMLLICSEYAAEHNITYNAKKSKMVLFGPNQNAQTHGRPQFFIDTQVIEYVNSYTHLGNVLVDTQSDADCIEFRRKQFIGQLNTVLSTFRQQERSVQIKLLHTFCFSFYGSVLWDLETPQIKHIRSAWHAAIKRVWVLPYNCHSYIASALGDSLPLHDELSRRVLKFHFTCLDSYNPVVKFVCKHALYGGRAQSPHGRNIINLCTRYSWSIERCHDSEQMHFLSSRIEQSSINRLSESEQRCLYMICELLLVKFNLYEFSPPTDCFSNEDVDCFIHELCVN